MEEYPVNGGAEGDGEGVENGEELGYPRKPDLTAVDWDTNNAMVFGTHITIEMANVINYNASVAAQKQEELEHAEGGEADKASKSFEQFNSVVLEEGVVRTKGPPQKECKSTSSENKENESPDNSSRRVRKSPAGSRW